MLGSIFIEAIIYGIMALGVWITFRVLNFPDLSVEGSFPMGAAVIGIALQSGMSLGAGLLLVFLGGLLAGLCTALIHNYLKVPGLLSGILTMIMLYSINIRILGRPNLSLLNVETPTIFQRLQVWAETYFPSMTGGNWVLIGFSVILILAVLASLNLFFISDLGISIGVMGGNEQMALAYGLDVRLLKSIGLCLSNALVAFSGALLAQYQGFADVGLGQGIIIYGLAMVMIGEFCLHSNRIYWVTFRVILGAILYTSLIYLIRRYGSAVFFRPTDLKLLTGLLIISFIAGSKFQKQRRVSAAIKRAVSRLEEIER